MRLIRRFFVTITAAFIMFSAGHTASNAAADRYYKASKTGAAACILTYHFCNAGYYLHKNGICIQCPKHFTSEPLNSGGEEACTIDLEPGKYYSSNNIYSCPEGYYCPGDIEAYNSSNQPIGRFDCPAGHYCPKGSEQPKPCEPGYYCPNTKQSDQTVAQLDCGVGKYCPAGSVNPQNCPPISLSGDGDWAQKTLHSKGICQGGVTYAELKAQPQYDDNIKNAKSDTDCQIKLEYNTTCGLVHLDNIKYDSGTYSNTANLTSYYMSLNKGYYLHTQLYPKDKCTNTDTSDDALPLYYSKAAPCTGEDIKYCYGLEKMPANCQEYNAYPDTFGIFKCDDGQYKLDTSDSNTSIPNFADCTIGSYCEECEINTCPAGYYCPATKLTATTYQNYKCPTGATSDAGSDEITDCFLSYRTKFQDRKGTFSLPMKNIKIIATGN